MSIRKSGSFILLLFIWNSTLAQRKDFCSWTFINTQVKCNERVSVGFNEHILRNENATEWWMFIHDFSLNQKITKNISQEYHVRLSNIKRNNNSFENRTSFYYILNGNWSKKQFYIALRSRWQAQAFENHWDDSFKGPFYYHRIKCTLGYRFNYTYKISVSEELFQPLNRPERNFIDQHRTSLNLGMRINKHCSMDCFYQIQQSLGRTNPRIYFILGTGINVTL